MVGRLAPAFGARVMCARGKLSQPQNPTGPSLFGMAAASDTGWSDYEKLTHELLERLGAVAGVTTTEAVKANETSFVQTFCISASWGSLIHAVVGSTGGVGRPANLDGLAA
jgi:hypothetical protein